MEDLRMEVDMAARTLPADMGAMGWEVLMAEAMEWGALTAVAMEGLAAVTEDMGVDTGQGTAAWGATGVAWGWEGLEPDPTAKVSIS